VYRPPADTTKAVIEIRSEQIATGCSCHAFRIRAEKLAGALVALLLRASGLGAIFSLVPCTHSLGIVDDGEIAALVESHGPVVRRFPTILSLARF